jgi:hypothetical protein
VSDAAKQRVPTSTPAIDGTIGTVTISQTLANGAYTVAYRTVSVDGHVAQGSYTFTVADPAAATTAPSPAAAPPAEPAAGIPGPVLTGLAALGVALAVLAGFLYLRGRRNSSPRPSDH